MKPQFTRAIVMDGSKFREVFEKGHPRNILVKLFQNQISGSREKDF